MRTIIGLIDELRRDELGPDFLPRLGERDIPGDCLELHGHGGHETPDFVMPDHEPRYSAVFQPQRRAVLARARNHLLFRALRDEDWILWLDVDVVEYPTDIIQQLLACNADIVHPNCVLHYGGPSFDRNAWSAGGKKLLSDMRGQGRVRLESVGDTMLLIRAEAILMQTPANWQQALTLINQARTSYVSLTTRQPLQPWQANSVEETWTRLKTERHIDGFLQAKRLHDLMRWKRDNTPGTHPWPNWEALSTIFNNEPQDFSVQGICFVVPNSERLANPNISDDLVS